MAITRLAQFHAETQNISELIMSSDSTGITNLPVIDDSPVRTGTRSIRIDGGRRPWGLIIPSTTQFWASVWFMYLGVSDVSSNIVSLFSISSPASRWVRYRYPENMLELSLGTLGNVVDSVSAYTTGFMRKITWMHLGLHYKADPVDGFCSFYIDGKKVLTFTGELVGGSNKVEIGGVVSTLNAWNNNWFDDFYVDETTGESDICPPPKRFLFSLPNAAGVNTEWAPTGAAANFQAIDEAPPDNDTSYVEATTVGVIDSYNLTNVTLTTHWEPEAVIPQVWAKELNGDAEIDLHLYDGVYAVGSSKVLTTSYASYFDRHTTTPDAAPWSQAEIDAIQMGMERST